MRLFYTLCATLICIGTLSSQTTFVDSFESYTVGDYLANSSSDWTTWGNSPGSQEDVKITDADAYSGSNSIFFESSNQQGGPTDIVLPFGNKYQAGLFTLTSMIKVPADKGGYFNIQAEEAIGQEWALNVYLIDGGTLVFTDNNDNTLLVTSFPHDQWFEFKLDINLNVNNWEVLIDGTSEGSFTNNINAVASLDIYPINTAGNGEAAFYMDDVAYSVTPFNLPQTNGAVTNISSSLVLAGQEGNPSITVRNLGKETISSFDIAVDYSGNQYQQSVNNVSLDSLEFYQFELEETIAATAGQKDLEATISNVNGNGADDNSSDDSKSITLEPVVPADGKMVVAEEATGTWCGWCPRGHVAMALLNENFSDFVATIAVHNGDPMVVAEYDNGMQNYIGGYPSALVDRGAEMDPTEIRNQMLQDITAPPNALLSHEANLNIDNNELTVDLTLDFKQSASGSWKVALVLTEDSVTGTANDYGQVNYYSQQSQDMELIGPERNWQTAPDPVPANEMVYDDVARAIVPSFEGSGSSIPTSVNAGDTFHHTFKTTLDSNWNKDNMQLVTMLIKPNGEIDNADQSLMSDATIITGIKEPAASLGVELLPNPTDGVVRLKLNSQNEQPVKCFITDISGKMIKQIPSASINSSNQTTLDLSHFSAGIYMVHLQSENQSITKKLVIK